MGRNPEISHRATSAVSALHYVSIVWVCSHACAPSNKWFSKLSICCSGSCTLEPLSKWSGRLSIHFLSSSSEFFRTDLSYCSTFRADWWNVVKILFLFAFQSLITEDADAELLINMLTWEGIIFKGLTPPKEDSCDFISVTGNANQFVVTV